MRGLVTVAGGFQPRSLLFQSKQFLLVFFNLGGGSSCPRYFDNRITEFIVGNLRVADHYLLRREVLEIVGIEILQTFSGGFALVLGFGFIGCLFIQSIKPGYLL